MDDFELSGDLDAADKIEAAIMAIADPGTPVDTGGGMGAIRDIWVTIGGRELFVTVKLSNNEIARREDVPRPHGIQ